MSLNDQFFVKVRTVDGAVFALDIEVARMSELLSMVLSNTNPAEFRTTVIPLDRVIETIMMKIIQWCTYHLNHASSADPNELSEWDRRFLKLDSETLFSMTLAADYLGIEKLYRLLLSQIVTATKRKEKTRIRQVHAVNLEDDENYEMLIDNIYNYPM